MFWQGLGACSRACSLSPPEYIVSQCKRKCNTFFGLFLWGLKKFSTKFGFCSVSVRFLFGFTGVGLGSGLRARLWKTRGNWGSFQGLGLWLGSGGAVASGCFGWLGLLGLARVGSWVGCGAVVGLAVAVAVFGFVVMISIRIDKKTKKIAKLSKTLMSIAYAFLKPHFSKLSGN